MLLFKISGLLLIIFTCYTIGFLKSNELKLRTQRLYGFQKGICELKERIRANTGEIDALIRTSFSEYPINYSHLEKEDVLILEDFFKNIGMSDTKAEYERCELYINLLKTKTEEANAKYRELSRLYKNLGLMSGIFICIFLL